MIIGTLFLELYFPESSSLKEKRMILRSTKDRIRRLFNISIAEIGDQDRWQKAQLGIAAVASSKKTVNRTLSRIINYLEEGRRFELVDYKMEIM